MAQEPQVLRDVSWRDLCPWLLLVRTFSLAIGPAVLLLATLAVTAIPLGWRVGGALFLTAEDRDMPSMGRLAKRREALPGRAPQQRYPSESRAAVGWGAPVTPGEVYVGIRRGVHITGEDLGQIAQRGLRVRELAYLVFGSLWTLLVCAFLGGTISRKAVVWLGREESVGLKDAVGHAWRKLGSYFLAPLYPLVVVGIITLCCAALGWLMRTDIGAAAAGLLWVFALLGGGIGAVLLIGLAAGWPLMWGATSAEQEGDPFEALSRSYSYVLGRPLNLLFYAAVAAVIGLLGWLVVANFCELTVWIASRGAMLGSAQRYAELLEGEASVAGMIGVYIVSFLNAAVRAAGEGYQFSYFWVAAAALYLLIRRDVDHTEIDEVFLEEEGERFALPALQLDAAGVPQAAEPAAESPAAETADPAGGESGGPEPAGDDHSGGDGPSTSRH